MNQQLDELRAALSDVALDLSALSHTDQLFLGDRCPEFDTLRTYLLVITSRAICCYLTDLLEKVFDRLVFLSRYLN